MTKVAVYARTSTNYQATGLETQLHALKIYCESKGIQNYEIYSDAGISGAKSSRPALNKLLEDVKSGKVSEVITFSLSRLSRSTSHLLGVMELLKKSNVGFVSLSESIDLSTAMGKMVMTVLAAVASLEREVCSERIVAGLVNARSKGRKLGAPRKFADKLPLIKHLEEQGLSHREISKLVGVGQTTVSRLLRTSELKVAG